MSANGDVTGSTEFEGAVLAGGRSRRFGRDKCAFVYRGRSLLEHALASLRDAERRMVVGGPQRGVAGVKHVLDERDGFGALGGVHAALCSAERPWVAVLACDMPFLPPETWSRLLTEADGAHVVMPEGPTGLEPLAALYHRELIAPIEAAMQNGGGSLRALLDLAPSRVVPWSALQHDLPDDAFVNANRREDLP